MAIFIWIGLGFPNTMGSNLRQIHISFYNQFGPFFWPKGKADKKEWWVVPVLLNILWCQCLTCRSGKSSCCRQSVELPISSTRLTHVTLSGWAKLKLSKSSSGELRFSKTWGELILPVWGELMRGWELISSVSILSQSRKSKKHIKSLKWSL